MEQEGVLVAFAKADGAGEDRTSSSLYRGGDVGG